MLKALRSPATDMSTHRLGQRLPTAPGRNTFLHVVHPGQLKGLSLSST